MKKTSEEIESTTKQQSRLEYNKLTFFYSSLPYVIIGQFLGTLLLSAMLFRTVDTYSLGIWLLLNVLVTMYRIYHYYLFRTSGEKEKHDQSKLWLDRYCTDVLVDGIIWGASAFLIFPASNLLYQAVLLLFLVAVGFTSMGVLASKKELLLTYALVMFIPVIMRLFFLEGEVYQTIAYSGLAIILIMILAAEYYGSIINKSLVSHQEYLDAHYSYSKLKKSFFSILEHAPVGVFRFDENLVLEEANTKFVKNIGAKERDDIIGKRIEEVWPNNEVEAHHRRVLQGYEGELSKTLEISASGKKDASYVNLSSSPLYSETQKMIGGISIVSDVTEEIEAKKELERLKLYDSLTGLPNRTQLLDKLKSTIRDKIRNSSYGALLFLDIDHFNNINRRYGQKTGDKILKKISTQFSKAIGDKGMVARMGTDVFVVLLPSLDEDESVSKKQVSDCITGLHKAFDKVLIVGEVDYYIGFTTGVSMFSSNDVSALELLKYSESALFDAKNMARGSVNFYNRDKNKSTMHDLTIANDIHKAIKNNELSIYYQPQQDIKSSLFTGAEALVRWKHPRRGFISPAHFIPLAEESGAIIELEEWIFERVFQDMRTMAQSITEFPLNYIAINVSSVHFLQPNFIEKFTKLAHKYHVNPLWVNIEITESGLMKNIDEAVSRIAELKRLGFSFSIDDFGTGYSSLTYLKMLPVDIIKIDRSFVKDADRNEGDRLIVESVIEISKKFGFKVLAEGIDRQETLDYFKTTDCKTFQGYLYYKPISMDKFIQLI